ncbi:MAG: enoyl-CoA hydratase/isomerase family protein [Alphaproteobacteria bacterium]|nr:enoyl-CoA hydratase/isomerase family protein [Alphaproteobacteria bacterium]
MDQSVLSRIEGQVGIVTLNKPDRMNAWDTPMRMACKRAIEQLDADPRVRAIILTGAGDKAFCAGQDLAETQRIKGGSDGEVWFKTWKDFYDCLRKSTKPVVCALNGVAAGSAYQFAMLCDVRVGHPGVRMGQPEINAGIPSVLGPLLMIERLGLSRTIELTLTGRMMDAAECKHIGLIHYLVPQKQVMKKAVEIAELLASKPPIAMRLNKKRFCQVTQPAFDEAMLSGAPIQREAYASGEPQRAMEAFFAERAARKKAPKAAPAKRKASAKAKTAKPKSPKRKTARRGR